MENFESQKYRDNLAEQLRKESDKKKRQEILTTAKSTPEYQEADKVRRTEERPFWGEFKGGEIDEVGEYKEPTPEQREKFEKRTTRVSEIFENADFQWFLDGATNISLYRDKLIRDHKDLDMSIFKGDTEKLDKLLSAQGFGIFVSYEEGGKTLLKKVTAKDLESLDKPNLSICKIGKSGKIDRETSDPFNFVDLHIHDKDANGDTVINYTGATIPKEFFEPTKKKLPNGKEINLSQPGIVAYHKLHSGRPYDLTDLQRLRPDMQKRDFEILRGIINRETEEAEKKIKGAWEFLSPIFEMTHNPKVIREKLLTHPDIKRQQGNGKVVRYVEAITEYFTKNPEVSLEGFRELSLSLLEVREQAEQKLKVINDLEQG